MTADFHIHLRNGETFTSKADYAAACGYSSDSAFTAMFTAALGQPPSHFRGARSGTPAARLRAPGAAAP